MLLFVCRLVYGNPFVAIGQLPRGEEHGFVALHHDVKIDLAHFVTYFVIVFVNSIEVENDGHVVLGKVPVVGTVVEAIGMFFVIVGVIEIQLCVSLVISFIDLVQLTGKFVCADDIHVVGFAIVLWVVAAHHVNVQVGHGVGQRINGMLHIVLRAK